MSKYVVTVFPDEAKAYKAIHALEELNEEGSISLYDTMVVEREPAGLLQVLQPSSAGALRTGLGALVGGLIGLFGGPLGTAAGVAVGSVAGGGTALLLDDVGSQFVDDICAQMIPGTFAVFAEVSESWTAPIDTRMQALGGKVMRENRADVVDDMLEKRAQAHRAEVERRMAARESDKAIILERRIQDAIYEAHDRLQRTAEKARKRLDDTKEEVQKKLDKLEKQAAQANPDVKSEIEHRIVELRADFAAREKKLEHAFEVAQDALQSPVP